MTSSIRLFLALSLLTFGFSLSGQNKINFDSIQPKLIAAEGPGRMFMMSITSDGKYVAIAGYAGASLWEMSTGKLIHQLIGHTGAIMSLVISPDDKYIVTGSRDGTAIVWELSTGKLIRRLEGHSNRIVSVAISEDGKFVGTASYDKTAIIWDLNAGSIIHRLNGHASGLEAIAFATSNDFIVTADIEGTAMMWDIASGEVLYELIGHNEVISHIKISPENEYIVTGSDDGIAIIWEVSSGKLLYILEGHKSKIAGMEISPDSKYVVTGSYDKTAIIWELSTGKLIHRLNGHTGSIWSIAISPNGEFLLTGGRDTRGIVWDLNTGNRVHEIIVPIDINTIIFSPDSRYAFTGSAEEVIHIWDISQCKSVGRFEGFTSMISSAPISPNGDYFITDRSDGSSGIWDFNTGRLLHTMEDPSVSMTIGSTISADGKNILIVHFSGTGYDNNVIGTAVLREIATGKKVYELERKGIILEWAISPNDDFIVTGSPDSSTVVWEMSNGKLLYEIANSDRVESLVISADGKFFITGLRNGGVSVRELSTGKLIHQLEGYSERIIALAISSDAKYICAAGINKNAVVWDFNSGKLVHRLDGHEKYISAISIDPYNKFVVTASYDNTAIIWDLSSGDLIHKLQGHKGPIRALKIDADGKYIATGSEDHTAVIWDISSGRIIHRLEGHTGVVAKVYFSPDGKHLVTASFDGSIILWECFTGKQLVRLFPLPEENWIALNPSGLFDATSQAMKWMHYVVGMEVVELDQIKERYYEPGLFEKAMAQSENLRDVEGMGSLKMYPETDSYIIDDELHIHLKARNGGIGKISLFVNHKEVISDANASRDTSLMIDLKQFSKYYVQDTINTISFRAYNSDGWLKSRSYHHGYQTKFLYPKGVGEKGLTQLRIVNKPHLYAVIVGTSDYAGEALDLQFADKDSRDIAYAIGQSGALLFGKENVHINWFTSDGKEESKIGSKKNIKEAFDSIAMKANPEDILLVYFSGHGVNYGSIGEEQFYYLTKDFYSGNLTDPEIRTNYAISTEEMTQWITNNATQKQVMILDACSSGQVVENLLAVRNVPSSQIRALDRMKDRTGMFVLAGSAADKVSYEATQFGQGLLTYSLLLGMSGAALKDGQSVDIMNLFQFARDQVPAFAEDIGGVQTPMLAFPADASSFDIGLVTNEIEIPLQQVKPLFTRSNFQEEDSFRDLIRLSKALDEYLVDASSGSSTRGVIFIDVDEYKNAYAVNGRYILEGDKVTIQGRLFKGKEKLGDINITGDKNQSEKLVEDILDNIVNILDQKEEKR